MKIAFFLTPKAEVGWLKQSSTVRQAIERMGHHGFTALPVLTADGAYADTVTEGDILWFLRQNPHFCLSDLEQLPLADVPRRRSIAPVRIDDDILALLALAMDQNFVPVLDDRGAFIGIVRRRSILLHFEQRLAEDLHEQQAAPPS